MKTMLNNECCFNNDNKRFLNLAAVPTQTEIANIEFDITLDCNLRCRYCYKGEVQKIHMPRQVAFDAIIWLIYASGNQKKLSVFFLGGEPLMNWSLIKELIPFGVTRAKQHGKTLTFGMTTNCTLVTDEVVDFLRNGEQHFTHLSTECRKYKTKIDRQLQEDRHHISSRRESRKFLPINHPHQLDVLLIQKTLIIFSIITNILEV
jgi:uncharacterized protein